MVEKRCPEYLGLTCVDGHCPNALAEEYPEFGYKHCSCDECSYYMGCDDCYFYNKPEYCPRQKGARHDLTV